VTNHVVRALRLGLCPKLSTRDIGGVGHAGSGCTPNGAHRRGPEDGGDRQLCDAVERHENVITST